MVGDVIDQLASASLHMSVRQSSAAAGRTLTYITKREPYDFCCIASKVTHTVPTMTMHNVSYFHATPYKLRTVQA